MDMNDIAKIFYSLRAKEEAASREGLDFRFDEMRGHSDALQRFLNLLNEDITMKSPGDLTGLSLGIRFIASDKMPRDILAFFWRAQMVGMLYLTDRTFIRINVQATGVLFQPKPPSRYDPFK